MGNIMSFLQRLGDTILGNLISKIAKKVITPQSSQELLITINAEKSKEEEEGEIYKEESKEFNEIKKDIATMELLKKTLDKMVFKNEAPAEYNAQKNGEIEGLEKLLNKYTCESEKTVDDLDIKMVCSILNPEEAEESGARAEAVLCVYNRLQLAVDHRTDGAKVQRDFLKDKLNRTEVKHKGLKDMMADSTKSSSTGGTPKRP